MTFVNEILLIVAPFLDAEKEWHLFLRYSTLAAAAFTSQGYITKNVVVVELFPTAIRNIANSFMGVTSRVGSMFAPQLFNLVSYGSIVFVMQKHVCNAPATHRRYHILNLKHRNAYNTASQQTYLINSIAI